MQYQELLSERAPSALLLRIRDAIAARRLRAKRMTLISSALAGIASVAGFMASVPAFAHTAEVTGFSAYLSLLASDSDALAGHLTSFSLSLIEAVPGAETLFLLFFACLFLVAFRFAGEALALPQRMQAA